MTTESIICDACKKPIDPKNGLIEFVPLRGGLTIRVTNAVGNAGQVVSQSTQFCGLDCLNVFVEEITAQIKPASKAANTPEPAA